ncbi:hypothetical protein [Prauserella muralis]|uniref:Uncharacterized protein n=1 Tax=Prauserella muralis TaxID=588067 RepID=A0A2V4AZL3_9PSEU|nr:hypothetical protein [Prauserella muralis]PXY27312.1 hypothetical protein BAY60_12760 [Prauserella muralis]TWE23009.1 hypothetical protein FHX69_4267 [Prauserella muralis]
MTSHRRRWAARLREEAETFGDLTRAAEVHCPTSDGVIASGFTFAGPLHAVVPLLGALRDNSRLRVVRGCLEVRYGGWSFETPLSNISGVRASGDRVHLDFHEAVHGHEPFGIRHRSLTVCVDDPERVAGELRTACERDRRGVRSVQD